MYEEDQEISLKKMMKEAPVSWGELQAEAKQYSKSVGTYLKDEGMDVYDWFLQTKESAGKVLTKARLQPKVVELYEAANAELSILPDKPRASFERYQATLDNQLYRAIRELRLLQDRRMNMVGTIFPVGGESTSE